MIASKIDLDNIEEQLGKKVINDLNLIEDSGYNESEKLSISHF
jgi:hypothetical protein